MNSEVTLGCAQRGDALSVEPSWRLRVVIRGTAAQPREVWLPPGNYLAGREVAGPLKLDHPSVSGLHFELEIQPNGTIEVVDLDSTNGTFVQGERITRATVHRGTVIVAGAIELALEPESPLSRPKPAPTAATEPAARGSFARLVPGAFIYPLKGNALVALLVIAVLDNGPLLLPGIGLAGLFLGFVVGGYIFAVGQQIVRSAAAGEADFPTHFFASLDLQELGESFAKSLGLAVICFGPWIVGQWVPTVSRWVTWLSLGVGCGFFPMSFLAVAMTDALESVNPWFILRSIFRAPLPYLSISVLFGVMFWAISGFTQGQSPSALPIPLVIVGSIVFSVFGTYLSFVCLRLLGLFYCCYRERLGWE